VLILDQEQKLDIGVAVSGNMNVLILTPDRVGSTLLQRLITVYMAGHKYDKPVINLHELTNGIKSYYSDIFNKEVLGRTWHPDPTSFTFQTLDEIIKLLHNADHYKTARIAKYWFDSRNDPVADQVKFYNYINENFYIISARRNNLFEHAISWGIQGVSKTLNVYSPEDKMNIFQEIYKNGISIHPQKMIHHLNQYREYIEWSDKYFQISSYFDYENDLKDIEKYILNLDIFPDQERRTWNDIFSIPWGDWNKCHKLLGDFGSSDLKLLENYTTASKDLAPALLQNNMSLVDQNYLMSHGKKYVEVYKGIDQLRKQGVLPTGIPIKLQTLAEKQKIIKNFDECIVVYNQWVNANGFGKNYSKEQIKMIANEEVKEWYNEVPQNLLLK
jgi:hypothetical protein